MLKNYASTSPLPNIFEAIEKTLAEHGARQIVKNYDHQGRIVEMSFVVETAHGVLPIRIPVKFDNVEKKLQEQGVRYKPDQPYRTAWATVRDWIAAQMAFVDWEQIKVEQAFLSYGITPTGQTFFEVIQDGGFRLESGPKDKVEEGKVID